MWKVGPARAAWVKETDANLIGLAERSA